MSQKNKQIYTVVEVVCGIADAIHNFSHLKDAKQFLKNIRKTHNLDEDDAQLFESVLAE